MAGNLLMSVSQNERERAIFRSRRMYQTDEDSNRATIIYKRNIEIARNLLEDGDSVEKIIRMTGLTAKEIEGLRE